MPNNWKTYKFSELYDVASGLSKSRDQFGFGSPFVTFKNVFYNYFLPEELGDLANTTEKEQARGSVKKGDVFLTRTSETLHELGMSSVALKDYPNATFNGFCKRLRIKDNSEIEVDPVFIGYYLRSSHFRREVSKHSTMTTRASLNNTSINSLEVKLPPFNEQIEIGKMLKPFDDKIELNLQTNKTLEEIAMTVYEHWFVDFEFPSEALAKDGVTVPYKSSGGEFVDSELGKIPKGWEVKRILDTGVFISDYVANGSFKSLKDNVTLYDDKVEYALFMRNTDLKANFSGNLKYVDKNSYEFLSKTKLFGKEIIISNVGDVGSVYLCPPFKFPMTLGNNVIMIKANIYSNYCYRFFISDFGQHLISGITGGSAQPKFNKTDFRNLKIIWPNTDVINEYNGIQDNIQDSVFQNISENQTLTNLRDTLLTKLISGEVRVKDVEQTISQAL